MQTNNHQQQPIQSSVWCDLASQLYVSGAFEAPKVGRKRRADKGMPDEAGRKDLARTYLKTQAKLWPDLVTLGIVPTLTEDNVNLLAEQFRLFFLGEAAIPYSFSDLDMPLAAAYLRFSDPGSNPRSLDQQLYNVLIHAKSEGYFIPSAFIFADAAETGRIAVNRRSYQQVKTLMLEGSPQLQCLYIDDVDRMNRNTIETLQLYQVMEYKHRRLIGVSDGTDSNQPNFKLQLTIKATLAEELSNGISRKVKRGMKDAFLQGKNIRGPSVAYKLVPVLKADGTPVLNSKGKVQNEEVRNPATEKEVVWAAHKLVDDLWSPERIAKDFNTRNVGGSRRKNGARRSWDRESILVMLKNKVHIGVEFENVTKKVLDLKTGKFKTITNPESEWLRRDVPHLRIMDDALFFRIEARIQELSDAYNRRRGERKPDPNKVSRASVYPRLLFRPVCAHCQRDLSLGSSGKYPTFCCLNGTRKYNDCPLTSYKSVHIVENAIVSYLCENVLTALCLSDIVKYANLFLQEESIKPKEDPGPMKRRLKLLKRERDRLAEAVATGDGNLKSILKELKRREKEIEQVRQSLRRLKTERMPLPKPLVDSDVEAMLSDLHGLLNENVAIAAPILRKVLGPIEVSPGEKKEHRRAVWIAKFTLNLLPALLHISAQRKLPTTPCLEFLTRRSWKFSKSAAITLRNMPVYEQIGPDVMSLSSKGLSDEVIARKLGGIRPGNVRDARLFATLGVRPKAGPMRKRTGTGVVIKYKAIAEEVAYLRDVKKMHFNDIAKLKKCSEATVRRAYDFAKPEVTQLAASRGVRPRRGRSIRLQPEVYEDIRRLIRLGFLSDCEIARRCKCGASTIGRERKMMTRECLSA